MIFLSYFKIQTCGNTLSIEAPAYSVPLKNISFYRRDIFYGKNQRIYLRDVKLRMPRKFQKSDGRVVARATTIIFQHYCTILHSTTLALDFILSTHANEARRVKCVECAMKSRRRTCAWNVETIARASLRTCKHNRAIIPDKMWERE